MHRVPEFVAILEDDTRRVTAMQACLARLLPAAQQVFFDEAGAMISWLGQNLGQVVLISLDHDLPLRDESGQTIDCGTGRDVVDYLATVPPTCPVIVHSSNIDRAPGMFFALKASGWPCIRVCPCDDLTWISAGWQDAVNRFASDGWIAKAP